MGPAHHLCGSGHPLGGVGVCRERAYERAGLRRAQRTGVPLQQPGGDTGVLAQASIDARRDVAYELLGRPCRVGLLGANPARARHPPLLACVLAVASAMRCRCA